jgi:hypothetical protein
MNDYFDKEIHYVRSQYLNAMGRVVDDPVSSSESGGSKGNPHSSLTSSLPQIKAEKFKTIHNIMKSIGNKGFFNTIFNLTSDAVLRMESIGRDDKKIFICLKNLYLLQLQFLTEGIIIPTCKSMTTILLKIASLKPQETILPPSDEYLSIFSSILFCKMKLKLHFDDSFAKVMKISPNFIAICKENRLKCFDSINLVLKESLHAWTLCISLHINKLFLTLQSKFDYSPKIDPLHIIQKTTQQAVHSVGNVASNVANNVVTGSRISWISGKDSSFGSSGHNNNEMMSPSGISSPTSPTSHSTTACNHVCKAIIMISHTFRKYEQDLKGFDFDELFWKPLGQQFVGEIISNIRKYKVTVDGAKILLRDLEEFHSVRDFVILFVYCWFFYFSLFFFFY